MRICRLTAQDDRGSLEDLDRCKAGSGRFRTIRQIAVLLTMLPNTGLESEGLHSTWSRRVSCNGTSSRSASSRPNSTWSRSPSVVRQRGRRRRTCSRNELVQPGKDGRDERRESNDLCPVLPELDPNRLIDGLAGRNTHAHCHRPAFVIGSWELFDRRLVVVERDHVVLERSDVIIGAEPVIIEYRLIAIGRVDGGPGTAERRN